MQRRRHAKEKPPQQTSTELLDICQQLQREVMHHIKTQPNAPFAEPLSRARNRLIYAAQHAVLNDPELALEKDLVRTIWKYGFYGTIDICRKQPQDVIDHSKYQGLLLQCFGCFESLAREVAARHAPLAAASLDLASQLQQVVADTNSGMTISPGDQGGSARSVKKKKKNTTESSAASADTDAAALSGQDIGLHLCHRCYIYAGDTARYLYALASARSMSTSSRLQANDAAHEPPDTSPWCPQQVWLEQARACYYRAYLCRPQEGIAYNQLAVLHTAVLNANKPSALATALSPNASASTSGTHGSLRPPTSPPGSSRSNGPADDNTSALIAYFYARSFMSLNAFKATPQNFATFLRQRQQASLTAASPLPDSNNFAACHTQRNIVASRLNRALLDLVTIFTNRMSLEGFESKHVELKTCMECLLASVRHQLHGLHGTNRSTHAASSESMSMEGHLLLRMWTMLTFTQKLDYASQPHSRMALYTCVSFATTLARFMIAVYVAFDEAPQPPAAQKGPLTIIGTTFLQLHGRSDIHAVACVFGLVLNWIGNTRVQQQLEAIGGDLPMITSLWNTLCSLANQAPSEDEDSPLEDVLKHEVLCWEDVAGAGYEPFCPKGISSSTTLAWLAADDVSESFQLNTRLARLRAILTQAATERKFNISCQDGVFSIAAPSEEEKELGPLFQPVVITQDGAILPAQDAKRAGVMSAMAKLSRLDKSAAQRRQASEQLARQVANLSLVVPDADALAANVNMFKNVVASQRHVVIVSMAALLGLDALKTGASKISKLAREATRWLTEMNAARCPYVKLFNDQQVAQSPMDLSESTDISPEQLGLIMTCHAHSETSPTHPSNIALVSSDNSTRSLASSLKITAMTPGRFFKGYRAALELHRQGVSLANTQESLDEEDDTA